ncbi:hypothetical protein [Tumebacillus flagellatus]|uniref:AAA domain-containing protein n=1 Tax=Tumebacillus flagellatus TaxID=1157490 RepID=A0A074LSK6_9BACL|nr:hypothetical protein [Tumebacillus flagellatus]KEO82783.1 hypothetical protein EL26_13625 [Tumebacillus flagellatus]
MKKMLFAGACDKSDLLLYIGRVLALADQKVLLVDATREQVYQDSVPKIDAEYRVTEFEGFDVANGFASYEDLQSYMDGEQEKLDAYDCLLIDTDRPDAVASWGDIAHHALVTTYEKRTIRSNQDLIEAFFSARDDDSEVLFQKVILREVESQINEEYVESTISEYPIRWSDPSYPVFFDDVDYAVKIENQFNERLVMKRLSKSYKQSIQELALLISGLPDSDIKKAFKLAERSK